MFGQLTQHVGEALVIQRGGHLVAPPVGHVLERVGQVGGAHALQKREQVGGALRVRYPDQAPGARPVDLPQVAAAGEAACVLAYRDADERPLTLPVRLHRHVDHDARHLVRLDRDPAVQEVFEDQQLVGALFEAA
ncbi:hypothetical protein GCM10022251_07190 [Phytohabitans flavus]|uniref:Uncharacterized protein n=1 Tax=Phytohabitans flavus TaxID=1076124 RepID=A0A6F8Y1W8_9ACTN|nr:hypothetical protein Pflav_065140 [Phytohabitans flavus]